MREFWTMFAIQLVAVIVAGWAVWRFLPSRIQWLIYKNSTRSDGTYSGHRDAIERASLVHCLRRFWIGLAVVLLLINAAALCFWFYDPIGQFAESEAITKFEDPPEAEPDRIDYRLREPLIARPFAQPIGWNATYWATLLVGWGVCSLSVIASLYHSAMNAYEARANHRFVHHYLHKSVQIQDEYPEAAHQHLADSIPDETPVSPDT